MQNLYQGKSVASIELMTLEVVSDLINNQKMRVLFADIDNKHQHIIDEKLDELEEMDSNLYSINFQEILRIKNNLEKEIDDFLECLK